MMALEQVSVINNLKGRMQKQKLSSGKRSNSSKDNISVVNYPSSISMVKINSRPQPPNQLEPGMMMLLTFSDPHDFNQLKLGLCPPPKPLHEYACALSLNLPQFCSFWRHCFGEDPQYSSYLLKIINLSFYQSLGWPSFGSMPRREHNFLGKKFTRRGKKRI